MNADFERASLMFQFLNKDSPRMRYGVVPGDPWSKSRPRFTKGRTFQPRDDFEHEQRTGLYLRKMGEMFTGNVFLGCVFFRSNRQRVDTDNLIKHVCDSGNGVLWKDDSQITAVAGIIELDKDSPRTIVVVGDHVSTMTRGTDDTIPCPNCGKQFIPRRSNGSPRVRCADCYTTSKTGRARTPATCSTCGTVFVGYTSRQKYCSPSCVPRKGQPRKGPK